MVLSIVFDNFSNLHKMLELKQKNFVTIYY
nr:MAG TPA: hypothetical protein [Caudoviricetes sp.]